jgi:hypothetical protein
VDLTGSSPRRRASPATLGKRNESALSESARQPQYEIDAMSSVFLDLDERDIERLRALGTRVLFGADEQILQEGDEADSMYFVDSGGDSRTTPWGRLEPPGDLARRPPLGGHS